MNEAYEVIVSADGPKHLRVFRQEGCSCHNKRVERLIKPEENKLRIIIPRHEKIIVVIQKHQLSRSSHIDTNGVSTYVFPNYIAHVLFVPSQQKITLHKTIGNKYIVEWGRIHTVENFNVSYEPNSSFVSSQKVIGYNSLDLAYPSAYV